MNEGGTGQLGEFVFFQIRNNVWCTPKLLVDSSILAVSSVYGYILFPVVISFWDKEHA